MSDYEEDRRTTDIVKSWEGHIRTITNLVVGAILLWIGSTLVQLKEDVAVMKIQLPAIAALQSKVIEQGERIALVENAVYRLEQED